MAMKSDGQRIDKPEPRWQAVLAFVAVAAIYLALPRSLIVGPTWLLPTLIALLLVPTVVSHRLGRLQLNRLLGFVISSVITLAMIGSVVLLLHRPSLTKGTSPSAPVFRRASLVDQCDCFRALVLADRRRRTDEARRAKRVWKREFSLSPNADPERRTEPVLL